jgi:tight adherence protein B
MSQRLGRRISAAIGAAAVAVLGLGGMAQADDSLAISHVEPVTGGVNILVSVPPGAAVDLSKVSVTIDGNEAASTAANASSATGLKRTAVLAIDTSNSMTGARFAAAKAAAMAYLSSVPNNVYVGIVTFDDQPVRRLEPTLDRNAAKSLLSKLTLKLHTALYDGVRAAISMAGTEGARSILILSDGQDTTKTTIDQVTAAIKTAGVLVDAVALEQTSSQSGPLRTMTTAGKGQFINADPAALQAEFQKEAAALARQIVITAKIPDGFTKQEATVAVSLVAGDQTLKTQAFVPVQGPASPDAPSVAGGSSGGGGIQISKPVLYGGVLALGLGLVLLLTMLTSMATTAVDRSSIESRIAQFTAPESERKKHPDGDGQDLRETAKQAAADMLRRNESLEARIANRLEAAGSGFKPSEWLLLHGAIAIGSGFVGLLLAKGVGLLIFLALGVVLPWVYLGFKRSRRLAAFGAGLADTLQLMSGSLSAGLSLAQSVDTIVREGNEPITSEFKRVLVETRLGVPVEDALEGVSKRMESKDFTWVVMAIRIQREVGGNLAELLNTVADTLREREYLRRQVKTLSAEGRLSAWILGLLPPLFMLYLTITKWDYVKPMYTTPVGWLMLIVAGVILTVGSFWMSKVVKVEV